MAENERVVAVTGAAGYVGARLLQYLEDAGGQRKLVAIDRKPLSFPVHNVAAYRRDIAEHIDDTLIHHEVTSLVHLAFIAGRGRNQREVAAIRKANLDSLKAVLESCVKAGVRHFIYLSSHTVYGPHRDNAIPLTDKSPLRPLPDFPYGYDKFLSERMIQEFSEQHADIKVTILRCCVVLGPHADNSVTKAFFRPVLLGVTADNPAMQLVYEEDLARVLAIVIAEEVPGVYNVAGEGVVFYYELAKIVDKWLLNLPPPLAYALVDLTWGLRIQRDSTAPELDLVRYPIVVDTSGLRQATGYRFRYTALETLSSFANSRVLHVDPE